MNTQQPSREILDCTNKVHFACFRCRKSFKQQGSSNWNPKIPERPFDCPECKQPMTRLGKYFKAPPQRAFRQWQKVELLYWFGERFHSSWTGLSFKCRTLPATVAYLANSGRSEAEVREALRIIRASRTPRSQ